MYPTVPFLVPPLLALHALLGLFSLPLFVPVTLSSLSPPPSPLLYLIRQGDSLMTPAAEPVTFIWRSDASEWPLPPSFPPAFSLTSLSFPHQLSGNAFVTPSLTLPPVTPICTLFGSLYILTFQTTM
ncbi:hypothetical protein E2C01_084614 [Portunus trituberculatus]|uniref:Uncharacterized protein n=1 Tax=Portunus trituberculatus TaxID=210409 RepID=A0A5B7IYS0_PORTR|nr:hypothetical protein [Portunus trituberculatus]